MMEELRQYVCAIVSARRAGPLAKEKLQLFLDDHSKRIVTIRLSVPRSLTTLDYMSRVIEAVGYFVEFCFLVFSRDGHRQYLFQCFCQLKDFASAVSCCGFSYNVSSSTSQEIHLIAPLIGRHACPSRNSSRPSLSGGKLKNASISMTCL